MSLSLSKPGETTEAQQWYRRAAALILPASTLVRTVLFAEEAVMSEGALDSGSRRVLLVVAPDPEEDSEEAERLAHQLRAELDELDLESITLLRSDEVPTGAKGEPLSMGALLVTLSTAGGVFTVMIEALRDWLGRHAAANRISVTIDGDTLELDHATAQERRELIGAYVRRHATG